MFDRCTSTNSPKVNATLAYQRWLWPSKFVLEATEETMASEDDIPDLSHIATGFRSGYIGAQGMHPALPIQA
jgi:hypothetical protein